MTEQKKSHYRAVFKSDHLGVADIEELIESGSNLIFTISHVKQEYGVRVAGNKGNYNIAYFKESIKPWVLNAGNTKIVKGFSKSGVFVEDWKDITVQLYIDPTAKFGGEVTGGVRIRPTQPRTTKPVVTSGNPKRWRNAIEAFKRDGNLAAVLEKMIVSVEDQEAIIEIGQTELDAIKDTSNA